jgi:mannose-6-phosphate isomerase-like protein (cupin superfamily)
MEQQQANSSRPSIVPRSDIPISDAPEDMGLEVRPFGAHEVLHNVMPGSAVGLAWTHARPGQLVPPRRHAQPGLLIILEGSAELIGEGARHVQHGDVITLPANQAYGFREVGAQGLHALHVVLGARDEQKQEGLAALKKLLAHNEARAAQVMKTNRFFLLLSEQSLDEERKRMMRECVRVFSDAYQVFLFTRQGSCRDERYQEMFHEHFLEELGHNKLLDVAKHPRAFKDPILRATSSWFNHQLLSLDNAEKTILNIALETAGFYFHNLAAPVFVGDQSKEYFELHAEADEKHKELGLDLLENEHPDTYRRLYRILDKGWDMMDAMTARMAYLAELDAKSA